MSEPPVFSPTVTLLAMGRVWEAALADVLKALGLTSRKLGLLGHVRATPGISFSELARRSSITVQSVHTIVAGLVREGLVDDGTAHAGSASSLRLTTAGERLLDEAFAVVRGLDERFTADHPDLAKALRGEATRRFAAPS